MPEIAGGKTGLNIKYTMQFHGIITSKYIDRKNHNSKTIEMKLNDSIDYYMIPRQFDMSGFYDFIEVNDSIFKKEWGFKIFIKRGNIDTAFVIHEDYIEEN